MHYFVLAVIIAFIFGLIKRDWLMGKLTSYVKAGNGSSKNLGLEQRLERFRKFLSSKEASGIVTLLIFQYFYWIGFGYFGDTSWLRPLYQSWLFFLLTSAVAFISGYLGSIEKHKIANHVARGIWALPVIYLLFVIPTNTGPGLVRVVQSQIDSTADRQSVLPIMAVDRAPRGGEAWELTLPTTTWIRIMRGQDLELCFEPFRGGAARIRASNGQEVTVSPGQAAVLPAGHWIDVISVDPRNPSVFKYWWVIGSCRPNRNI